MARAKDKSSLTLFFNRGLRISVAGFVSLTLIGALAMHVGAGEAQKQATAVKKYPPYPDVWGYEFPWPEKNDPGVMPDPYRMPNGEIVVTYTKRFRNAAGDYAISSAALELFSGKKWDFRKGERNAFRDQYGKYRVESTPITFSDGSVITQESHGHTKCFVAFAFTLVKKEKAGQVVANKTLVHLPENPRTFEIGPEACQGTEETNSFKETVETIYSYFVPLEDDTFLVYDKTKNFVLWLDKDLNSRYKPGDRFFLIDRAIIEKLTEGKEEADKVQAVYQYVTSLKERSAR